MEQVENTYIVQQVFTRDSMDMSNSSHRICCSVVHCGKDLLEGIPVHLISCPADSCDTILCAQQICLTEVLHTLYILE
jgi:hypothetical protein